MSKWINILMEVVVFTAIIGTIAAAVVSSSNNSNITGGAAILIGLTTLFVIIGFITYVVKQSKGGR